MSLPDDVTELTRTVTPDQHQALLHMAFTQISPIGDWRGPIDVIVPYQAANIYLEAIRFMTATIPTAERCADAVGNPCFRLRSVGYRAGPAGP